jgi:hypothetical protein
MSGLGHLGFGFAAKRLLPKLPLALLLAASEAIDLIYLVLILARVDSVDAGYLSHGLFMSGIWTLLAAAAAYAFSRDLRAAAVMGAVVFSHWALDFIVWPMTAIFPDAVGLPLFFRGSPRVGLGLYRWFLMAIIGDLSLLLGGVAVYVAALKKIKTSRR